jgi:hypothetical protein
MVGRLKADINPTMPKAIIISDNVKASKDLDA